NEVEQYASSPQTRYSLMASGEFEMTDHIKFFSDARYAQSRTKTFLAGTNASFGWETTIPYNAATDSPVNNTLNFRDTTVVSQILANCNAYTCSGTFANPTFVPHGTVNASGQAVAGHPVPVQMAILLNSRLDNAATPTVNEAQTTGWVAETYPLNSFGR